jgi:hypothetical protein
MVSAETFNYFKLKGPLKEKYDHINSSRQGRIARDNRLIAELETEINQKLINGKTSQSTSPLYQAILNEIGNTYEQIGETETRPLLINHNMGGGLQNYNGLSWYKPLGSFKLGVDRQVVPDLMDANRWIVHDTLFIEIEASTLLSNLNEQDLIDIPSESIAAFAGVSYYRTYHSYHYAESFLQGLTSDYSMLFLPFTKFNANNILNLEAYTILKRQDQFSFNAGGVVDSPSWYGFSFRAGVLASMANTNELTIQSLGEADARQSGEILRISHNKQQKNSVSVNIGVQLDFFNLLKMTILAYDLEYSYEKEFKTHLSFYDEEKSELTEQTPKADEFKRLIKMKLENVVELANNQVQEETRVQENLNSRFSALIYSNIQKIGTQLIKVKNKNNLEKYFFRHLDQRGYLIQNWWSKIVSYIASVFKLDPRVKNTAKVEETFEIEYEAMNAEVDHHLIKAEDKFSLNFKLNHQANNLHKKTNKKIKNNFIFDLKYFSMLEETIITKVVSNEFKGPFELNTTIRIDKLGLQYFNKLSVNDIFQSIMYLCHSNDKDWLDSGKRATKLKKIQTGKNLCVKKLGKKYLKYKEDFISSGQMNLIYLKNFVSDYYQKANTIAGFIALFGKENPFIHGTFSARDAQSQIPFQTHFKSGEFKGLGVIDNFIRSDGTSTPPTIWD